MARPEHQDPKETWEPQASRVRRESLETRESLVLEVYQALKASM